MRTQYISVFLLAFVACCGQPSHAARANFRAGAAAVDISPTSFPARIAGGFLESQAQQAGEPLFARCFAFDDGQTKIVFAIVDSCMVPRGLIDEAKREASQRTGIPVDHMLVSATHTHSAPAAGSALGTREDAAYAARLPGLIAAGIAQAVANLQPARIGWAAIDDWQHTHNRRWIRHADKMIQDPFGDVGGLANMHPGYLSADIVGPSGPIDPALSVLAAQTPDGKPLAVLANYSQHYFGAAAVSADYYGEFCKEVAVLWGEPGEGNGPFVCAMSQGTSGDCMWMDYGAAAKKVSRDQYARAVAQYAHQALRKIVYRDSASLAMVEKRLQLQYRVPDEERLAWARPIAAKIEDELPKSIAEVYANEALFLHDRQQTEIVLQAIRIGDLTICALPNEVYALTGLKLRARSPASTHFNISLANGADGYIPPPEQHALGGYTTWPAATAGLEVDAEPKIVATLVEALAEVTGKPARTPADEDGPYAKAIRQAAPRAWWRLNDSEGSTAHNALGGAPAKLSPGFAWYLPGPGSGTGIGRREKLTPSPFSGPGQINRAVHLAGGDLRAKVGQLGELVTVTLWVWLGEASGASERSGTLVAGPRGETLVCRQDDDHRVQMLIGEAASQTRLRADDWHFVVLRRDGLQMSVFVDGRPIPELAAVEIAAAATATAQKSEFIFGAGLQGKLDEIAVFDRLLTPAQINELWQLSGVSEHHVANQEALSRKAQEVPVAAPGPESEPISPTEALKKNHVPAGYRLELAACEPQVLDPVAFDWDPGGRLWVVEMADYPLGMDGKGKRGGRIRVLEDRDEDGHFETSRLFASDLNFPNGILTWRDGVLVSAAPEILFLRDTDGNGKADRTEVLIQGFSEGNQQLRVNGLRWGLDGWVYCAAGGHHPHHGVDTRIQSKRSGIKLELGSRDFRFQPDSGAVEPESGPTQFGRNRDAWGHWFGTQNVQPLWHYVLADRYSARNPYVPMPSPVQRVVSPDNWLAPVYPASSQQKRFHSFQEAGHFTSACGGMIYNDIALFGDSRAQHAFTCEPFHNLVQHNVIEDAGVSFAAHRAPGEEERDFFASEDRWCRPVMARTGPDGGLWIADMYRYMIEHPDWLPAEGKAELLPHYRLGEYRGRIYRVVAESAAPRKPVRLDGLGTAGLVAALDTPNDWQRDKAQQLLLWKADRAATPLLEKLVSTNPRPQTRVQALCTLDCSKSLTSRLLCTALADASAGVKENALRISEAWGADAKVVAAAVRLANDPDAKVRLQLALSLGEWPASDAAADALAQLAVSGADDPLMVAAVMSSALPYAPVLTSAILRAEQSVVDTYREPLLRLALGANEVSVTAELFAAALSQGPNSAIRDFTSLVSILEQSGTSWEQFAAEPVAPTIAALLAGAEKLFDAAKRIAESEDSSPSERIAAATLLARISAYRSMAVESLSMWLRPQIGPDLQQRVLEALNRSGADQAPEVLGEAWEAFSPTLREQALDLWLSRSEWTEDLLDRIEKGSIASGLLDPAHRDRLLRHPSKTIARRAANVLDSTGSVSRAAVIAEYRSCLELSADPERGKAAYLKGKCGDCHRRGSEGAEIGPNLATVLNHSPKKLLSSILDPNAEINPGYQRYNCQLDSGLIVSGLLTAETANSVTIKLEDGSIKTLARAEIEFLQNSSLSLMPEGLEKTLQPQELADLIALLRTMPAEAEAKAAAK